MCTSRPLLLLSALLSVLLIKTSNASILVHVVQNDPTSTNASIVPSSSLPSADFTASAISFTAGNSDFDTLATFLNNPVFSNTKNGFNSNQSADNTFLQITSETFLNAGVNSFVVGHDDGVVLTFSDPSIGTVVNSPGPTSFDNSPFNITVASAGLYSFTLNYTECCGGAADLLFTVNGAPPTSSPEPSEVWLAGSGLTALALGALRARSASVRRSVR